MHILRPLPEPREQDGEAQLRLNGERHTASRRRVELGQDDPGDLYRLFKARACWRAFCPVVASMTSQTA